MVLPIVTREFVAIINPGADANETVDLSNFGFLYGTFPTAPGVFVYATQFGVDVDLVASAVTAGTFLSAPLMFISAKMLTLTNLSPSNYIQDLDSFLFDISIISLIATVYNFSCNTPILINLVILKIGMGDRHFHRRKEM